MESIAARNTRADQRYVGVTCPNGMKMELATAWCDAIGGGQLRIRVRGLTSGFVCVLTRLRDLGTEVVVDAGPLFTAPRARLDRMNVELGPYAEGFDVDAVFVSVGVYAYVPASSVAQSQQSLQNQTDAARGMSCWRCDAPVGALTGLRRRVDGVWRDACRGCGHIEDAPKSDAESAPKISAESQAECDRLRERCGMPLTPGGADMLREQFGLPPAAAVPASLCPIPGCRCPGSNRPPKPVEPLDVEYDGVTLRRLLAWDERQRNGEWGDMALTPAQRAAVSAHWSAELRAKVAASAAADKERERLRVRVDLDDEELPW